MTRELDRRDFSMNKVTPAQEAELQSRAADASARLPEAQQVRIASFDATTGNPRVVTSEAAPAKADDYIQRALDHVRNISGVLGLAPTQPAEFVADPHIQRTSSNAVTVNLQQQYKGIPIFQAAQAVRFAPDGALQDTTGSSVTVAQEVPVSPKLSVQEAVLRAAEYVAVPQPDEQGATDQFGEQLNLTSVDLTGFVPKIIATFPNKPDSPTVLEAGPFGDEIKASLIWFPLGNELRLAWEVIVTMPAYEGQYRTMVDANSGEILYCHQLVQTVAAQGNVYLVDGGSPRQMTNFPLPLGNYGRPVPGGLPTVFPDTWVAVDSAVGNCTNGHQGDNGPTFQGAVINGLLTFDPANAVGVDQEILNIFYYCCYMHDYFYLLGFREADGNFQQDDFGRGGVGSDRVDARAYPGAVAGTASMFTPVDGSSPVMKMGLVTSTNRHTALDSSVIFHEFMHGVTNRLVGGPLNVHALDAIQSGGMGEGWGDYDACTINNSIVVGAWVVNNAGGIRGFPYDSNFPDNFGNLGTGRYTEVHNIGEIWCATLMEMTRNIGKTLGVQLVVDALKLSPANPSFLDMRDAILRALDNKFAAGQLASAERFAAWRGIWSAFAKFGMGPGARSNGAQLAGIVADFRLPTYQGFLEQTGTPIGAADGAANFNWAVADFNRDGTPDLIGIKVTNTGTNMVEVHVLSGATSYQAPFLLQTGTPIGAADGAANFKWAVGDFNRDGILDLIGIKVTNTGTNTVEVHVLDGATNYQSFLLQTGTPIDAADGAANFKWAAGDFNRDGIVDLIGIKVSNTGTGMVEAHVLNGATNYQAPFLLQTGTAITAADGETNFQWAAADFNRDGNLDLFGIKVTNTGTNMVEVHVLDGA